MACNSVVSVSYTLGGKINISATYVPLVSGTEGGKPYYTWYDPNLGLSLKMYWDSIQGRWEMKLIIDDYVFAFLNLAELDCPGLLGSNDWVRFDDLFEDVLSILDAPVIPVDLDTSCCLNVKFINEEGEITIHGEKAFPLTFPASYMLDFNLVVPGLTLLLSIVEGFWQMADMSNPSNIYFVSSVSSDCPESTASESWDELVKFPYSDFIIYSIDCDANNNDIPADVEPINCDVPCSNGNLLKKQKSSLSKDIADISKREVFGLKCSDNWENIFMRSLIIDALSCIPYGVYSKDTEACLISKLTDKCNC